MHLFPLIETSEKTLEINVLSDFLDLIEKRTNKKITVISPTQQDENKYGFDEIIDGMPAGQIIAFQFKRPYAMRRPRNCVRFIINTKQLGTLLNSFFPSEAYYVFTPFPFNSQLVANRGNLLKATIPVDIYNIPKGRKTSQKTRTVRIYSTTTINNPFHRRIEIADPRKFEPIKKVESLENLTEKFIERKIGLQTPLPRTRKEKSVSLRNLFYIHLSSE